MHVLYKFPVESVLGKVYDLGQNHEGFHKLHPPVV